MEGICVVLITLADITMRGATLHPNVWILFIRG
jgi:hypothetical protein